jgi:transcriptional regulator with XRE-family HTH domain
VAPKRNSDAWGEYARALGTNLHRARIAKGLSQEWLAHEAGIASFTYQKLEKGESNPGKPANPTLRVLMALAAVLDTEIGELLPRGNPEAR